MLYQNSTLDHTLDVSFCYGGWDQNLPPGIQYGPVIRNVYIVECCTGGKGAVIINGVRFPLQEGDCYLLRPGDTVIHQADWEDPRTGVWCAIYGLQVEAAVEKAGITAQAPFVPASAFAGILRETAALVQSSQDPDEGAPLRQRAHIYGILGELLRPIAPAPKGNAPIEQALKMMEACYHQPLTVERMAQTVHLERCYFSIRFKEITGQSPHQYLAALRVQRACALLRSGDFSIATVAAAVGIAPENFSRLFKKHTGVTPGQYRKNHSE